jgi:hypothetical protein
MTFYMTTRANRLLLAAVVLSAACAPSDVLDVQDPDIINPTDVQSPAGADAVRLGALARFTSATSGAEGLFLLGGLFSDEWINGDSFIARQEIDQRVITPQNTFLTDANRVLHRARLSAQQAIELLEKYKPEAPAYQVGEMYFVQAFVINMMAEHYCDAGQRRAGAGHGHDRQRPAHSLRASGHEREDPAQPEQASRGGHCGCRRAQQLRLQRSAFADDANQHVLELQQQRASLQRECERRRQRLELRNGQ